MAAELFRCMDIHNQIVRLGWHVTSAPFISFWEKYSQHHAEMEELLGKDLVDFYKKALVPAGTIRAEDPYQNFFYHLQGLAQPWERNDFDGHRITRQGCEERSSNKRHVLLYVASAAFRGQQSGIIYDQRTGQALVQSDFLSFDPSVVAWRPLSTILASYLDLIALGKVTCPNFKTTTQDLKAEGPKPQYPWAYHSYYPEILARTLAAYHDLIAAIETAREMPTEEKDHELTVYLSTHFNLDAANFPKVCFARAFLTKARRPRGPKRTQFIAPGIELPSTMTIRKQPYRDVAKKHRFATGALGLPSIEDQEGSNPLFPPYLLFHGQGIRRCRNGRGDESVFAAPFDGLEGCPVGLWLDKAEPWSGRGGEDEAVMVLPFGRPRQAHAPSQTGTITPLFVVLEDWAEMVKCGKWKVDEKGVTGGIELLREERCEVAAVRGRTMVRSMT